ncbi:sigma-70 family RNA polymerase sigma factor [Zhenhengia yiwuensis]|uniref:sigma-70 family RNA polymerase sigma factor n=1 Tax=Zhenhengia yiwuensis TaxID=2763666 RepID=UPI002A75B5B6|nr:sigma-70 family RNA polymerase sigma factor [Zhenhengia yiwuensis]MDY3369646.1 sigma-70 family RNA polymerase sigma factor [Zhenhengia yiwuensis]
MDKKEFTLRVEAIKKQLYKIAYLYLGNEASALEAVDEAVYRGFKARKQLRQPEYLTTWLTRILINECKKELKRLSKMVWKDTWELEGEAYDYDALPLQEAIEKLPAQLKEVVILRYFSGYTLSETAQSLEIPQGTLVTRQRRALQLLRLELGEGIRK